MSVKLDSKIEEIPGAQNRFLPKLRKLGIKTVGDLIMHFPIRYEDWREVSKIADLTAGYESTIHGIIQEVKQTRTWQKRMIITDVLIGDETGSIRAIWFNQPYIGKMLEKGKQINISGKVSKSKSKNDIYFSNPIYELIPSGYTEPKHTARLVSIYPETKGLTSKGIRFVMKNVLDSVEEIPEFIPSEVLEKLNLPEINDALRKIHLPENIEETEGAKKRFAFQDLFLLQLRNTYEKKSLREHDAPAINWDSQLLSKYVGYLPFEFTESQKKSLDEILNDISKPHPMNRLLQGDVGSGKTAVAGITALVTAENGFQSAFMAPTEILARQHYKTFQNLFGEFEGGVGLLLSKEARVFHGEGLEEKTTKAKLLNDISDGKILILVGTHALIQKNVEFRELGFVVIDEQHRFGVKQRAKLVRNVGGDGIVGNERAKRSDNSDNSNILVPHFLSMSATPIPRTIMMTVFGNLDISLITELPKGRREIITKIVDTENRDKAYAFIRGEVRKGRQVYVVCPRIEKARNDGIVGNVGDEQVQRAKQSDKRSDPTVRTYSSWDDVKAVEEEYEKLSKKVFPDLRVGMLHGKLKSQDKDEVMKKFVAGESDILVSTSVIEVGIDVKNATIMMIESADRFGLAQLYQFRGRVGRGEHQSFCFLFTESELKISHDRLESLLTAKNSFELAEKDLAIRGPGEFLGEAQSGMPDLAMKAIQNPKLLKSAEDVSREIINKDPELTNYPELKKRLSEFGNKIHLE